jgi:beta-xylosidase
MKKAVFLWILVICLTAFTTGEKRPVHIFMAGDSTMANKVLYKPVTDLKTGEITLEAFPERGWGMLLPEFFTDDVVIENYAKNGRSTRSFIEEGLWAKIISNLQNLSKVWVSDLGNGQYKNPVLHADYSDPDVCRVGEDYYMTASSFNCIPGLPVLHSKDLVNWTLIGAAIPKLVPEAVFSQPQHGNGVWAPSIRYHAGEFYIYFGDPDYGIYMTKTKNPAGEWEALTLVKAGKGLIDACPFWDEDGQAYLVHAFAGSRAGIKSLLAITRLTPDGKQATGQSKIIYDGHDTDETVEGPKLYKRNGYYYILAPAGGVATGWQLALRAKNIFGPYERKVIMTQGNTPVNGPHQGAWVDTKTGEDWFIHFQDKYAFGRVVHLQPMQWLNDWPVIGDDKDGDGCGEPVLTYKKPDVGKTYPIVTPVESDEFSSDQLGLQWQWQANPADWWYFTNSSKGVLSLYSVSIPDDYKNLWDIPNLLLQKFPATDFTATAKMTFVPSSKIIGERTGLVVMGLDYALLSLENTANGWYLSQNECLQADKGAAEKINAGTVIKSNILYLRVKVQADASCTFSYSVDGENFQTLGNTFKAKEGKWIGAKVGLFCSRPVKNNDGGRVDVDWFRII